MALAVPMWIEELRHKSFADFENRREAILESVCYNGDLLLYGSKKKGKTAQLFNDLAEGLAWLALIAKGGVTFGDQHWDAEFEAVPDMQEENHGASQSEDVSAVLRTENEATDLNSDDKSNQPGKDVDRKKAGD